jgi:hypothetical protein
MKKNIFAPAGLISAGVVLIAFMALSVLPASAQTDHTSFYARSLQISNKGMYVLGTWALANMSYGAYGWSKKTGSEMYFHQMNLFWNVVNASIAGFALYSNMTTDILAISPEESMNKHLFTERILLINSGLDVAYMGAGLLMRHFSDRSEKRADLLRGYGNSLMLQGGFLLAFDLVLYGLMRGLRMDFLQHVQAVVTTEGVGLAWTLNLMP